MSEWEYSSCLLCWSRSAKLSMHTILYIEVWSLIVGGTWGSARWWYDTQHPSVVKTSVRKTTPTLTFTLTPRWPHAGVLFHAAAKGKISGIFLNPFFMKNGFKNDFSSVDRHFRTVNLTMDLTMDFFNTVKSFSAWKKFHVKLASENPDSMYVRTLPSSYFFTAQGAV